MTKKPTARKKAALPAPVVAKADYDHLLSGVSTLLEEARRTAARTVNVLLTTTYWEMGRRIVEFQQGGKGRADYGERLLQRLARDLMARIGRGFGVSNLKVIRKFYLTYEARGKGPTPSGLLPPPSGAGKARRCRAFPARQCRRRWFPVRLFHRWLGNSPFPGRITSAC